MVSVAGLKRKQGEMDVKDSKSEDKISKSEEVYHNIAMCLTAHSGMGDALCFELGEDLGRFSINEFCLITGLKCVGSTHLPVVESRLISRYFLTLRGVSRENLELQMSNAKFDNDDDTIKLSLLYIMFSIPLSNASAVKIDPKFLLLLMTWMLSILFLGACSHGRQHGLQSAILWTIGSSKFTTKYEQAIPRMMSWTTVENVKFDDVVTAFTTVGESETTSPGIGSMADIGVQVAMEFLTADKVIVSHEDAENDMNQVNLETSQAEFVPPKQVDEGERIPEGEEIRDLGIQTKDEKIPKKKRARLSRLGQRPARPMTNVGSPSTAPTKQPNPLPPGLADEPPQETLEEFREWIKKGLLKRPPPGKRPPRYGAKYELFGKPHDLGFMVVANKTWLMLGVRVQSGSSWFEVNALLIPIHFADLKHWALVKLELTNWTIEVLFEFKPRKPPGTYPIPVTIMTYIPRQGNRGDCGIFTIKNAECLIEGRDVQYWVIQERMQIFREWMACYLWGHARQKLEGQYKSDNDIDMDF
ncbi:hypothetical protein TIFTF001_035838 [Ficus carica]|uniref:Ubiquitin-like protease family profile domain-containing protein n=1 Tax=Ficus carica TaxID=3494 RepID=A0AA88E2N6_FICCA|nr:hypothetical protein TIFTF001_035838 [Ficus carica]